MPSLRTIVLLGAAVYLLPTDPARQQQFIATASNAYEAVTTICEERSEACDKAYAVFDDLKSKAQFGAGVIYALATGSSNRTSSTGSDGVSDYKRLDGTPSRRSSSGEGTLTPRDLAPAWRGDRAAAAYPQTRD